MYVLVNNLLNQLPLIWMNYDQFNIIKHKLQLENKANYSYCVVAVIGLADFPGVSQGRCRFVQVGELLEIQY